MAKRSADEQIQQDQSKHQKRTENPNPVNNSEPTKIIDIIDDCLKHIFRFLNIKDLLNAADTCKRFRERVTLTFVKKYRIFWVDLKVIEASQQIDIMYIEERLAKWIE